MVLGIIQTIASDIPMHEWSLSTLSEILAASQPSDDPTPGQGVGDTDLHPDIAQQRFRVERFRAERFRAEQEWGAAIVALNSLLQSLIAPPLSPPLEHLDQEAGLVLSGPSAVLSQAGLGDRFSNWVFTSKPCTGAWTAFQLPPSLDYKAEVKAEDLHATPTLLLPPTDPLAAEQFCLVSTPKFSLVMVLGKNAAGLPDFSFSFDPEVVEQSWQALRSRVLLLNAHHSALLETLWQRFLPAPPDYKQVTQFAHLLLQHLPQVDRSEAPTRSHEPSHLRAVGKAGGKRDRPPGMESGESIAAESLHLASPWDGGQDVELLQAIAHEIRTPLTTIRTLTRLLLKRRDLASEVLQRLKLIDRECTEQIDRFGLIFRAVELETATPQRTGMPLTPTPLNQVFQHSIPRWQEQAQQRGLKLEVVLPEEMPTVVSDPTMLDQALTSLIERFTRNLPAESHIQVQVTLAGAQLKLKFQSQSEPTAEPNGLLRSRRLGLRSLGRMLVFQPETGNLSLNLAVTKNLFQALGGKLKVQQDSHQGEVLTIFLPLDMPSEMGHNTEIYTV